MAERAGLDRLDGAIAWRIREARINVQAAIVEIVDVLLVELLGLGIGVGDTDGLREAGAIGRGIGCVAVGDTLPVAVHQRFGADVAAERQVRI